jgi:lysophospholipase L1-like esterase
LNVSKALEDPYVKLDNKEVTLLEAMKTKKFDKVFIMLGFNELGWPNYDVFLDKYSTLISEIKKIQPDAKIYLQSILHVTESHSAKEDYENNPRVNLYNKNIKKLADNKTVFYINLNPCFDNQNKALKEEKTELEEDIVDLQVRLETLEAQANIKLDEVKNIVEELKGLVANA